MIVYAIRRGDTWYTGKNEDALPVFGGQNACKYYAKKSYARSAISMFAARYKHDDDPLRIAVDFTDIEIVGFNLTRSDSDCTPVSVKVEPGKLFRIVPIFGNEGV